MFHNITLSLRKRGAALVGSHEKFQLESRIFHTISIFVGFILVFETAFNLYIGLLASALLSVAVLLIQIYLFYISRFKNKVNTAVLFSVIEINIITGIGYFYNAGLSGATLLLFAASLYIILSVSKKKHWKAFTLLNVLVVFLVTGYEYLHPESIRQHYATRGEFFADNVASYLVTISLIYIGTAAIRKNYIKQKHLADEKTLALELLNAEKVKLFSIIAHDLRTPLASVQQYFDVMTHVEMDAEERAEMEKSLMHTIGNTQELLTNLLKWAKNQMDGGTARLQAVKLSTYLDETTELFEAIALKKDITLTQIADESIIIKADPDMLQLVIRNLLNNAVKFTPNCGKIELKAVISDANCIISITDNGIGIPLGKQGEIFSLNVTSTTGTHNEKGTGLGLVLCKDYTELQGGRIWFTSVVGQGSTFYISLPLVQLSLFTA